VWKTVSQSPFANAVVFVSSDATITPLASLTATITGKDTSDVATVFTLELTDPVGLSRTNAQFVQTQALTTNGIAVQKYGAVIIPADKASTEITLVAQYNGTEYTAGTAITASSDVGDTVTLAPAP
jgi:hypothetical protein